MARSTSSFGLSLPAGWPTRVRSAVLHAISLAHVAVTVSRSHAANNWNARVRLKAENQRLRQEISLLEEEARIKDCRMLRIPAHQRPHYPPIERMAILELRSARGWSLTQTAQRFLLSTATVASWMHRRDEDGPAALVQLREPVNRYPEFVAYLVRRLKLLCPALGYRKLVQFLGRAGLHLSATTVRRMIGAESPRKPAPTATRATRASSATKIIARHPHHTWQCDLTTVPTSLGLWTSWLPFALPQRWPFCWWVGVVVDHYSRCLLAFALYEQLPNAPQVRKLLARAVRSVQRAPRYLISDHGTQFCDLGFRAWCRRHGIRQRFGAIGKFGSIALIERLMRTLKQECTRRLLIPYSKGLLDAELALFSTWYNGERPHQGLHGATPDEIRSGVTPACLQPRFEPRPDWPRASCCAGPQASVRGRRGARLRLHVGYLEGRKHLPIVTLQRVA